MIAESLADLVGAGQEIFRLDGFNDFQVGDMIECYTLEKVAQKL